MSGLDNLNHVPSQLDEDIRNADAISLLSVTHSAYKSKNLDYTATSTELSQGDKIKSDITLVNYGHDCHSTQHEYVPLYASDLEDICNGHHERCQQNVFGNMFRNFCNKFCELCVTSYQWIGHARWRFQMPDRKATNASELRRDRIKSEIVLLDTRSELDNIKCVSLPFDEDIPAYYAISYRWGEHAEWNAQTPNYTACITSISRGNLIKLCELLRFQTRYIWIDVISINQADKEHRKMAIKNMDNIYRRADMVIAVPDLCYCDGNPLMEDVTKEDIEAGILHIYRFYYEYFDITRSVGKDELSEQMKLLEEELAFVDALQYDADIEEQLGDEWKGYEFISLVVTEWAERAWVLSERTIGVKDDKLEIYILRGNAVFFWELFGEIEWDLDLVPADLFKTIFDSKSTKYIDRLFAIFPHTKHKYVVQKLVDEDISIDNEDDLRWLLFDILDMDGRNGLLKYFFDEHRNFFNVLPLPVKKKGFQFFDLEMPYKLSVPSFFFEIEPTTHYGKRVLKVSCPFIYPYRLDCGGEFHLPDAGDDLEMVLVYQYSYRSVGYRYHRSNGVWKMISPTEIEPSIHGWKYGEFLVFPGDLP
ncbi:hypothetical protein EC973_002697 [Apophysomyces ossiformis]|uniref:Heterokaryon incompatibility domain-containing protein n=1 Tax=Apophysomyces ossiformis TaxID=679940 RepID=A0A8H7BGD7_9FUNG|nr:hypothetical protein EC973_002697 [Apophysomyces ossiformis]